MNRLISPRFKEFTISFPLSNTFSPWIQMFSDSGWTWLQGTSRCHLYVRYVQSTLYSQLQHTSTSRRADWQLWVMDEAKERKQSSWHETITTMQYHRQGKVRSCRSTTGVFSRPCTNHFTNHFTNLPLTTTIWNRTRKQMVKTPQDKLFL